MLISLIETRRCPNVGISRIVRERSDTEYFLTTVARFELNPAYRDLIQTWKTRGRNAEDTDVAAARGV